jgi:DNA-directed RNA polymerase subunit RPC12/RpoP
VAKSRTIVQNLGRRLVQQDANRGQGELEGRGSNAVDRPTAGTAGDAVNRLVCEDCGTVYYSAAAKTMAEEGERCAKCGGRLHYANGPDKVPVTVPPTNEDNGD